ncbi:cell division protein DivIVA [Mycolicibacterium moriokaense]|nr:cell division protein DivIVA [Mycolicibacterium moriokaense]
MGYSPAAVDAALEALTAKQQFLVNDVESLRARLGERDREVGVLRTELADLVETSPSPHAVQRRMADMLRRAVDDASQMQADARTEAQALIAEAKEEAEAERRAHQEAVADLTAERDALAAQYEQTKKDQDAELAGMRAEARSELDGARHDAQEAREQLIADAKQEAEFYREQAQRAVHEARQTRIKVLEQLMSVYRDLDKVPAALEAAYREAEDSSEAHAEALPDREAKAG